MLSLTLRKLERDGLVIRTGARQVPRVGYELSDLATTLIPHAVAPANWAVEHNPDVDAHRAAYDSPDVLLRPAGGVVGLNRRPLPRGREAATRPVCSVMAGPGSVTCNRHDWRCSE